MVQEAATLGVHTPPHITLQIDDYRRKVAELEPQASVSWPRHNLPPRDYAQFVGRQQELEQITRTLSPRSRSWVVTIDGVGGIGKSALALKVAHVLLARYGELPEAERFDAIVWVSAKRDYLTAGGVLRQRQRLLRPGPKFAH